MTRIVACFALTATLLTACSSSPPITGAGGCGAVKSPKDEGQGHIQPPEKGGYATDPPTSGKHYGSPAATGVYSTNPPEPEQLVHNLEHGHVVIWIVPGRLPENVFNDLVAFVRSDDTRLVLVPRARPFAGATVNFVMTSWGHAQECTGAGNEVVQSAKAFAREYAGKGPEGDLPGRPTTG